MSHLTINYTIWPYMCMSQIFSWPAHLHHKMMIEWTDMGHATPPAINQRSTCLEIFAPYITASPLQIQGSGQLFF